ncbi:MAG: class I SAM-dependent methyltransferase, partial [Candidatus Altiarchaeota archaeon]|nr:class I SAM-dependent methyltransferase [Candidatus Altiarchaeota archaeon]
KAEQVEPSANYAIMDIKKLDYEDSSFDGVFCNGVLHHLDAGGMKQAIKEFYRVLKPEGVLFVSTSVGYDHTIDTDDKYGPTRTRHLVSPGVIIYPTYNMGFNFCNIDESETNGNTWLSFLVRKLGFSSRDLLSEMTKGALAWGNELKSEAEQYR